MGESQIIIEIIFKSQLFYCFEIKGPHYFLLYLTDSEISPILWNKFSKVRWT